jgi:hypothetical protein
MSEDGKTLVRPEKTRTATIARVFVTDTQVSAFFPEKRDDFKTAVRRLGYEWSGIAWTRTGATADNAAELVRDLLAAGFCVKADTAVIEAAVSGAFKPEPRRWVNTGTMNGIRWFVLGWKRDEDCYHAAKRLPGARYSRPNVIVPADSFEEVMDFAGRYGFHIGSNARALAEEARQEQAAAIVVSLPPEEDPLPAGGQRPRLQVPADVEIDPDLLDDLEE